ncbi:hypothetical protein TSOC_012858 [Tetrabaena socialis]|uniref:EGF domain-specific O-linked N-acetylglucosamine transferase n=1 Tax=Tetrabaena socialis TaxID=47790 RepID=A0A2J7ZLX3_9CHLO|nr:hypothetical protein TSOC_012858 [Tetrabaena socialis]|eukprot:PNH01269.1 hypothetical protein TSOC_012858 [Tetrabaena socialis]
MTLAVCLFLGLLCLSQVRCVERKYTVRTWGSWRTTNWSDLVSQPAVFVGKASFRLRHRAEGYKPGANCAKYVGVAYLDYIRSSRQTLCGPKDRALRQLRAEKKKKGGDRRDLGEAEPSLPATQSSVDCYTAPFVAVGESNKASISLCRSRNMVLDTCAFFAGQRKGTLTKKFPLPNRGAVKLACDPVNTTQLAQEDREKKGWLDTIAHDVWWANATRDDDAVRDSCAPGSPLLVTAPTLFVMRDRHANYAHEMEVVSMAFSFLAALEAKDVSEQGMQVVIVDQAPPTGFLETWARMSLPHRLRILAHDPFPAGTCFRSAYHVYTFAAGIGYNTNPDTARSEERRGEEAKDISGEGKGGSQGQMQDKTVAQEYERSFSTVHALRLVGDINDTATATTAEAGAAAGAVAAPAVRRRGLLERLLDAVSPRAWLQRRLFGAGQQGGGEGQGAGAARGRMLVAPEAVGAVGGGGGDIDEHANDEDDEEEEGGGELKGGGGALEGAVGVGGAVGAVGVGGVPATNVTRPPRAPKPPYVIGTSVISLEKLWAMDAAAGDSCRQTNVQFKFVDGDFNDMPYHQQLQLIFRTGVLVGVHGAGLTHGYFLPPAQSAVLQLLGESFAKVAANNVFRNMAVGVGNFYEDVLYQGLDVDVTGLKAAVKRAMDFVSKESTEAQLKHSALRLVLDDQSHFQVLRPEEAHCPSEGGDL